MTSSTKESLKGVQIATDYRAVAHLVEGLILLLLSVFGIVVHGVYTSLAIVTFCGIFDVTKGLLLLQNIVNENRKNLNWYLALSFVNFILKYQSKDFSFFGENFASFWYSCRPILDVFLFFHDLFLFFYVLRFYWNVGTVPQKIKEHEDSHILLRIVTNFRAVAHIVEGIIVCLVVVGVTLYFYFFYDTDISYLIYSLYGIFECAKGTLLLRGIIKEDKTHIRLYSALGLSTLVIKLGLVTFASVIYQFENAFIYVIIAVLYFVYEWYLYYCVVRFGNSLQITIKCEKNEKEICNEKLDLHVALHV